MYYQLQQSNSSDSVDHPSHLHHTPYCTIGTTSMLSRIRHKCVRWMFYPQTDTVEFTLLPMSCLTSWLPVVLKNTINNQQTFFDLWNWINLSRKSEFVGRCLKFLFFLLFMLRVSLVFHTIVPLIDLNNVTWT